MFGQELGLVLARDRELAALLLNLAEEPRVLDGQRRLGGERLQELTTSGANSPGVRRFTASTPITWSSRSSGTVSSAR
jgi:hypothetical protein